LRLFFATFAVKSSFSRAPKAPLRIAPIKVKS
jgi:hypothetical protein